MPDITRRTCTKDKKDEFGLQRWRGQSMHSCKAIFTCVVVDGKRQKLSQRGGGRESGQLVQNKVVVRGSARLEAQLEVDVVDPGQLQEDKSGVSRGKSVRDMQGLSHLR